MSQDPAKPLAGTKIQFTGNDRMLIVASRYNQSYVDHLLKRCKETLLAAGLPESQIAVVRVPGAGEIPVAIAKGIHWDDTMNPPPFAVAIALGMVIAGETPHHEVIAHSTANALQELATRYRVPVINGIIVTNNNAQADDRVYGAQDRGKEFADTAVEMFRIFNR
ncbi:MAG: 6,7-dimethyl-8-ribityllumazine synthase [Opitutales bacterium]|nr:6,7-dimethyl-8-ribityllumazine synthase [Opitutales bacterium]